MGKGCVVYLYECEAEGLLEFEANELHSKILLKKKKKKETEILVHPCLLLHYSQAMEPAYLSINRRTIKKMWSIYTMKFYADIRKK